MPSQSAADELQHEALAMRWLEARGVEVTTPAETDLMALVRDQLVHARLGAYELYFPDSALRDADRVGDLRDVFAALVSAQERWVSWLPEQLGPPGGRKELAKDVKTVATWLEKWSAKDVAGLDPLAGKDLLAALEPRDNVREALSSLEDALRPGGAFGSRLEGAAPPTLVLLPTRADFVEFACVVGWVIESGRHAYWASDVYNWTEIDFQGTRALAMEFAGPQADEDYTNGVSMRSRNPRGLVEHVTQLATRSLLDSTFGDRLEPMVAAGLANSLVIDEFGEIDTRTDGDLRSSSVDGRSMFIPASMGGQSTGGALPPGNADSRWRTERGKGHFVRELRAAQKQGAKEAPRGEQALFFQLESEADAARHGVRAPFLGATGRSEPPPQPFLGDYIEFLRAYRAGFLFWLRTEAGGRGSASEARFASLLARLADPQETEAAFPAALEAVYGAPLSSATPGSDDLEGRFLLWLAKQK